jgi:carbamoyl-phosphate synthase large subunit
MKAQKLNFTKMQGCGNDYIYFDCFDQTVIDPSQLSIALSDRHFGIGGDGVVLITPSKTADGRMRMFNADGSEGAMCGNAIRCVSKYLYERRGIQKETLTVETASGIKKIALQIEDGAVTSATVDMGAPILKPEDIPVLLSGEKVVGRAVTVGGETRRITCVSMGNPHCVIFTTGIDLLDLEHIGPPIERDPIFPKRVNTEFVEVLDSRTLNMRVWERGSGETLACGTGACAAAVAAILNGFCKMNTDITVRLRGGELIIRYTGDTVLMTGPAVVVFEGSVEVE